MIAAQRELLKNGFEVDSLGLLPDDNGEIGEADIILLPVPTTKDGKNIFCPLYDKEIPLDFLEKAKRKALVISYGYKTQNRNCKDCSTLDEFAILNAVPTAEGAIAKALCDTDFCLWQSRVLVIGYGRIGKILADRLKGFRCNLTVSARKKSDFALLDALDINFIHTDSVPKVAGDYDIIFNTVDALIFKNGYENLKSSYIYDLSTKGCIDCESAAKAGIKVLKLPGIPAKTAYITAGKIIAKTVIDSIEEVMQI